MKISGNAFIQSGNPIHGGGPDCVSCHDISGNGTPPDKRIDERVGFGRGAVSLVIAGFHDPTLRYRGDNCEKIW